MAEHQYQVQLDEMAFEKFNDINHIDNFLKYLFRIDKSQKWTNDRTAINLFIVPRHDVFQAFNFSDDINIRQAMRDEAFSTLGNVSGNIDLLTRGLLYIEIIDDASNPVDVALMNQSAIMRTVLKPYDLNKVCFGVVHLDQGVAHLHAVFLKSDESDAVHAVS